MSAITRANSSQFSSGAETILSNRIGFAGAELDSAKETIHTYSMPQEWGDCSGWLRYIARNIDHIAGLAFNWITFNHFAVKSDWTKLEERTVSHFTAAADADPEIAASRVSPDQNNPRGVAKVMNILIPNRITGYAKSILGQCLTAQARQLDPAGANALPNSEISLQQFLNKTRGDVRILTAMEVNEHGVRDIHIDAF